MNETLDYYEKNAENYANSTANLEFSEIQDMFLKELKDGACILDFGCGSGRDTRYFLQKGYQVTALDGSAEMCRIAEEKTGIPVIQMDGVTEVRANVDTHPEFAEAIDDAKKAGVAVLFLRCHVEPDELIIVGN